MTFADSLRAAQADARSCLCVGLDPDPERMPSPLRGRPLPEATVAFCRSIVEATAPHACAFKPNLAFFEALGPDGWRAFEEVVAAVPPARLVIADAKRGDIGNTARMYARAFFERTRADAVTVSPYMGRDAVTPFLEWEGRAAFVLVLTSNPGAEDLQTLDAGGEPVYLRAAHLAVEAGRGRPGTVGFVVGATRPERLAGLRAAYPRVPFLVPGVGAQGASAAEVAAAGKSGPLLVNSSRGVLYASAGSDFARAAAEESEALREALGEP